MHRPPPRSTPPATPRPDPPLCRSQTFKLPSGSGDLKSFADTQTQSTQPLSHHFCSNFGSQLFALTPLNLEIVSVFAGGWVKIVDEWVPMREADLRAKG